MFDSHGYKHLQKTYSDKIHKMGSENLGDLMFDFDFGEEDFIYNLLSQAHPNNQPNPTIWNLSQEQAEQRLSTESVPPLLISEQNLTGTTNINAIEHLDPSPEIIPDTVLPSPLSVNSKTIIGAPQDYNLTTDMISSVHQPLFKENHQPQLDEVDPNPRRAHVSQGNIKEPLISTLNDFSSLLISSFGTPFSDAPPPYFPTLNQEDKILETDEVLPNDQFNTQFENGDQSAYLPYNYIQQALIPYQTSFPKSNSTGLGSGNGKSHENQLPLSCLLNYPNPPHALLHPSRLPIYQQQLNQAAIEPSNLCMSTHNPVLVPRRQELNDPSLQLIFGQAMPNVFDSQIGLPSQPFILPRPQSLERQGLLNQTTSPSVNYPSPSSSQMSQVLNSSHQQVVHRSKRRRQHEVGESSLVKKRPRRNSIGQEKGPPASVSQSKKNRGDKPFNVSRLVKNSMYDLLFESIGLPVDPHLRRFAKLN